MTPPLCPFCGTPLELQDGMPVCPQCSKMDDGLADDNGIVLPHEKETKENED
jgi:uncharacterized Zn finger protein (UPF0148 family)